MKKGQANKHKFGLIGKNISYSFSRQYFTDKFDALNLEGYSYENFDIQKIDEFPEILNKTPYLRGLNVTIPYKEEILNYLDECEGEAKEIGAVNTIKFLKNKRLKGFNTDAYGFEHSLVPMLKAHHDRALILGTGGASKAINYVLNRLQIMPLFVSRKPKTKEQISYNDLNKSIVEDYTIIINCTPLGTYPDIEKHPQIPYQFLGENHLLYDLIYNPVETVFLKKGKEQGAKTCNGLKMLELQAEKAWEIWTR